MLQGSGRSYFPPNFKSCLHFNYCFPQCMSILCYVLAAIHADMDTGEMQARGDILQTPKDPVVLGTYDSSAFILSLRRRDEFSKIHSFGYHCIPHIGEYVQPCYYLLTSFALCLYMRVHVCACGYACVCMCMGLINHQWHRHWLVTLEMG